MRDRVFLNNLRIRAYRNFVDLYIDFELDSTVLIGENNAGKTNILDAIYNALRVNRTVKQGAFDLSDYNLRTPTSMAGDAGPIELTATFQERSEDEWPRDIVSQLNPVINLDVTTNLQSITLQVVSTAPGPGRDEDYDWNFLDISGNRHNAKHFGTLTQVQKLRPFFRLNALRDASREFTKRSTFFGAFVSDPTFDDAVREDILQSLESINEQVLNSHAAFGVLRDHLMEGNRVVQSVQDAVGIEAVPSRLSELLSNTQVSFLSRDGVPLPLERHGSGTQSLSVISLFRAYISAKLAARLDPLSEPISTIEEPEAHLHPTAIRGLWNLLKSLPGQKIITTHSGDMVSEVPLKALRRLSFDGTSVTCRRVDESAFTAKQLRNINYQIRHTRGELLFANTWLLVEGRSESTLLPELARIAAIDLLARGVRLVEIAQHGGPAGAIKLADQLGIKWHVLTDSDRAGQEYARKASAELRGRTAGDYITMLTAPNLESYLCEHGFVRTYEAACPTPTTFSHAPGTRLYFDEVAKISTSSESKETLALQVVAEIEGNPALMPETLLRVIRVCTQ